MTKGRGLPARLAALRDELTASGGGYLLGATLAQSVGQGAAMACNAVFFVHIVGLAPGAVGAVQSAAALTSMALAVVIGPIVDRTGARAVAFRLGLSLAGAVAAYALVFDLLGFVLVHLLVAALRTGRQIGENALIGQLVDARTKFRAYQRSVQNIGFSLGTAAAAIPLYLDTRAAYLVVIFLNAAVITVGALLLRAVPGAPVTVPRRARTAWRAIRDRRYVAVGLLCGLMEIRDSVLTVGLPLWVVSHTDAPKPVVAALLFVNTALVITLQVRASRGAATVGGAARVLCAGGAALAVGCVLFGLAGGTGGLWTVAVLVAGAVVLTFGEMWTSASSWTLSYDLADAGAHGQYQGVFEMTSGIGVLAGPILCTTVALSFGFWGWAGIGAGFVIVGLAARRIAGRGGRGVHQPVPAGTG
ncbi:MFS transporter [Amycolatopsis roodepoortensis]|uniref:MFS family permease n=1 Tax=Amycolatopsis roodepoortensis TaxID=700274 RepID=A0ABR9L172_9PSEU|nr:MFS transporter [Amycolatopsis roodepoortensis]MBE1574357.1 MFS family permease [Amycolatopsis roodepoortensis]